MDNETIKNEQVGPWAQGIKWGIILMILSTLLFHLVFWNVDFSDASSFGGAMRSPLNFIGFGFMLLCIIMAQVQYRKNDLGGFMSYGRAVGVAVVCLSVSGLLEGFYTYIFYSAFHPEAMITQVAVSMEQMEKMNMFTPEELDKMYENNLKAANPAFVAISKFFSVVFIGTIISLITSIFTRKNNPEETF